jgi:CubicO group peptidase (beta-lactamase class C family)
LFNIEHIDRVVPAKAKEKHMPALTLPPTNAWLFVALFALAGCSMEPLGGSQSRMLDEETVLERVEVFTRELDGIRTRLDVAGVAYAVIHDGERIASGELGFELGGDGDGYSTSTAHQIASVTKTFTATIAMQLVEEGLLDLDAPVVQYLPDADLPEDVKVIHLLTHTSECIPGEEFVYSTHRFALLGDIIESVTTLSFADALETRILEPAGMTIYESPNLHPHNGLVSSIDELAKYVEALDTNALLNANSMNRITIPTRSTTGLPLRNSIGWFVQDVQGVQVIWAYGQFEDTPSVSSLVVRVPSRALTLVMMSNGFQLSDYPLLVLGDLQSSAVAMSFYRLFIASSADEILPALDVDGPDLTAQQSSEAAGGGYDYTSDLLSESYLSFYLGDMERGERLMRLADAASELSDLRDPTLHTYLGFVAHSDDLIAIGRRVGERLLAQHPNNRRFLQTQAQLLQRAGALDEAIELYVRVLEMPNQNNDYFHLLTNARCMQALAIIFQDSDPDRARQYLTTIIASGIRGQDLSNAQQLLADLQDR